MTCDPWRTQCRCPQTFDNCITKLRDSFGGMPNFAPSCYQTYCAPGPIEKIDQQCLNNELPLPPMPNIL
jgi:hypothetical protein